MLIAKEKLEDMKWLEELLDMYRSAMAHKERNLNVLAAEIKDVRNKIATHDYEPLEKRRQASIKLWGKESVYY